MQSQAYCRCRSRVCCSPRCWHSCSPQSCCCSCHSTAVHTRCRQGRPVLPGSAAAAAPAPRMDCSCLHCSLSGRGFEQGHKTPDQRLLVGCQTLLLSLPAQHQTHSRTTAGHFTTQESSQSVVTGVWLSAVAAWCVLLLPTPAAPPALVAPAAVPVYQGHISCRKPCTCTPAVGQHTLLDYHTQPRVLSTAAGPHRCQVCHASL